MGYSARFHIGNRRSGFGDWGLLRPAQLDEAESRAARLRRNELANSISHGFGFLLSVAGAIALTMAVYPKGDGWRIASCRLYAATLVAMYAASTLSHAIHSPRARRYFRILDQAMIFLLIAGSYTPFALIQPAERWWIDFALVWGVALGGFSWKILSGNPRMSMGFLALYLLLGWVPGMVMVPALYHIESGGFWWIVGSGLCYTVGTVFLNLDEKIPYGHLIWHLLVIAGSGCHYIAVFQYCGAPI